MQARMRGLESSDLYLFNCERRDFGERHSGYLLGRVLHRTMYENDSKVVHTPRENQVPHVS